MRGSSVIFAESLPDQCPPIDAQELDLIEVYRLLKPAELTPSSFASHAALGKERPSPVDPCRWASCSLVLDAALMKKLPKFKNCRSAVKITIPASAGRSKINGNHIDFWPYAGFSHLSTDYSVVSI